MILYDRDISRFEVRGRAGTWYETYHPEKNFHQMHEAFATALETGEAGELPTAEQGLRVTAIADDVTRQAVAGRVPEAVSVGALGRNFLIFLKALHSGVGILPRRSGAAPRCRFPLAKTCSGGTPPSGRTAGWKPTPLL